MNSDWWHSVTLRHPTGDHVVVGSYDRRVVRCFLGLGWWNSTMDAWYTTQTHPALWNDGFFIIFLCCFLSFRISQDWVLYIMDKMAIHDKPDRMFRNLKGFRIRSLKGTSFGCIASCSLWQYSWIKVSINQKLHPSLIDTTKIIQKSIKNRWTYPIYRYNGTAWST